MRRSWRALLALAFVFTGVGKSGIVARKIAATMEALGLTRFDMKYSAGTLGHDKLMRSIELYGREVIPRVRELVAAAEPDVEAAGPSTGRAVVTEGSQ